MKTPVTQPQRLADDDEEDWEGEDEEDAPPRPDEEPDGQPDPGFD